MAAATRTRDERIGPHLVGERSRAYKKTSIGSNVGVGGNGQRRTDHSMASSGAPSCFLAFDIKQRRSHKAQRDGHLSSTPTFTALLHQHQTLGIHTHYHPP